MNAYQGSGAEETHSEHEKSLNDYEVILKFSVKDANLLWRAAAQRLQDSALELDEIEDTIGPVDDPVLQDCLMLLAMPEAIEGCVLAEADIYAGGRPALVLVKNEIVAHERIAPVRPLAIDDPDADDADWRQGLDAALPVHAQRVTERTQVRPN